MDDIQIRNFRDDDIKGIVQIFETLHNKFSGFISRTPEMWRYLFLEHPIVNQSRIFVAQVRDEIKGYIVVGPTTLFDAKVCWIYEFCAESSTIVSRLLEEAISYSTEVRAHSILIEPIAIDDTVLDGLGKHKFAKMANPSMKIMSTLIDATIVLRTLVDAFNEAKDREDNLKNLVKSDKNILFKVGGSYITMCIQQGEIIIEPAPSETKIIVEMSHTSFIRVFLGLTSPFRAYMNGELKIKGWLSIMFILKLVKALQAKPTQVFPPIQHF